MGASAQQSEPRDGFGRILAWVGFLLSFPAAGYTSISPILRSVAGVAPELHLRGLTAMRWVSALPACICIIALIAISRQGSAATRTTRWLAVAGVVISVLALGYAGYLSHFLIP